MDIKRGETSPTLEFFAYNTDGSPKTDANAATGGWSLAIDREQLASVAVGAVSDKPSATAPLAAWSFRRVSGNQYVMDIDTTAVATLCSGLRIAGTFTGGYVVGVAKAVVEIDVGVARLGAAVAGDEMDLVNAPNATAVIAIQSGLSTFDASTDEVTTNTASRTASKADVSALALEATLAQVVTATETTLPGLINALNQSAARRLTLATSVAYEIGDSGDETYHIELRTFADNGTLVASTSSPTLTVTGATTGDLSGQLSAVSNPSAGVYRWTYTVADDATIEQIWLDASAVLPDGTYTARTFGAVADAVATDFTSADRANLQTIIGKLPTAAYLVGTANANGTGYSTHSANDARDALLAVADSFKAAVSGLSTHSATDVRDAVLAVASQLKADVSGVSIHSAQDVVDLLTAIAGTFQASTVGLAQEATSQLILQDLPKYGEEVQLNRSQLTDTDPPVVRYTPTKVT